MIKDTIQVKGSLVVELFDEKGELKEKREIPNLVVNAGRFYIAQRMINLNIPTAMSHMALGGSNTQPAPEDPRLGTELGRVGLTGGAGRVENLTSNSVIYAATFGPGVATGVVREAGIFNSATANSGAMLARTTFGDVTKAALDSLAVTWTVSING